jgi:isopenicillin-N epimerase
VNVPPVRRVELENWMRSTHKLRLSAPYYIQKKDVDRFLEKYDEFRKAKENT